jgi:hypothetical protein
MKKILIVECAKSQNKRNDTYKAKDLYNSDLFKKNYKYALSQKPDEIFILSSKHGLLEIDKEITPYNVDLKSLPAAKRKSWAAGVVEQLKQRADIDTDEFVFLASEKYMEYITPHIKHYLVPMRGKRIGEKLQWLNKQIDNDRDES